MLLMERSPQIVTFLEVLYSSAIFSVQDFTEKKLVKRDGCPSQLSPNRKAAHWSALQAEMQTLRSNMGWE